MHEYTVVNTVTFYLILSLQEDICKCLILTFLNGNFDFLLIKSQGRKLVAFLLHIIFARYLATVGWINLKGKGTRYNAS
jgi:hypothetical protein